MATSATMLKLDRNFTLATNKGHVIEFKKGVPTHVPPAVYREALAIGASPADGSAPQVEDETKPAVAPSDPAERSPAIKDAIGQLMLTNAREDFTAAGVPAVDAVSRVAGFKVQAREIATVWQEMNEEKAGQ